MSAGNHKVQRILLELTNSETETYKADEQEFSKLINGSFTKAIEELLNEVDIANTTIRIPKLDLDLGTIQRPFQKEAILSVFKERLRALLPNAIDHAAKEDAGRKGHAIDVLIYFLKNGTLPWWASSLPSANDFSDPAFKAALKNYFYAQQSALAIDRLVNQFSFKILKPFLTEYITQGNQNTIAALEKILAHLSASESFEKRRSAQFLLKKIVRELVAKKNELRPFAEFISEYSTEDPAVKALTATQNADYLDEPSLAELDKLMAAKALVRKKTEFDILSQHTQQADHETKAANLWHYLTFGSLPPSHLIVSKQELDFLLTEFILKRSKQLHDFLNNNVVRQNNFTSLLIRLPEEHFKTLMNALPPETSAVAGLLKEQFAGTRSALALLPELKTAASVLILNQALKKTAIPLSELYTQSAVYLSTTEKIRLKEFLTSASEKYSNATASDSQFVKETFGDADFEDEIKKSGTTPLQENNKPDATYFSDLLTYFFEYNAWPWWGNLYAKTFGDIFSEGNWSSNITTIVNQFESIYPDAFAAFSKVFINSTTKPSLIFSKLSWELSKKILDKALPTYKNNLSDTIEAVLKLILQHRRTGLQAGIVTQQVLFFIIDEKKEMRSSFKELANRVITSIAVILKLPLWEIYGLLAKHYDTLDLKNKLSKEEAVSVFAYHESLEEQYLQQIHAIQLPGDPVVKTISEISLISDTHEKLLLNYLSGDTAVLKHFPSAWALQQFITERLKHSLTLFSNFQAVLKSADLRAIYRLIQLEQLSGEMWINTLLPEKENMALQEELLTLLYSFSSKQQALFKNVLRTAFIKEQHWFGQEFSAEKLKKVLVVISSVSNIPSTQLELEILRNISGKKETGILLREIFGEVESPSPITQPDQPFLGRLKEMALKKQLENITSIFKKIGDIEIAAELFAGLQNITEQNGLLRWLEQLTAPEDKKYIIEIAEQATTAEEINTFSAVLKTALLPVLENTLNNLFEKKIKPAYVQAFINLLKTLPDFPGKDALLVFIDAGTYPDKKEILSALGSIADLPEKKKVVDFVNSSFPEKNNVAVLLQHLREKQKIGLIHWKEKLNFEVIIPEHPDAVSLFEKQELPDTSHKTLQDKKEQSSSSEADFDVSHTAFKAVEKQGKRHAENSPEILNNTRANPNENKKDAADLSEFSRQNALEITSAKERSEQTSSEHIEKEDTRYEPEKSVEQQTTTEEKNKPVLSDQHVNIAQAQPAQPPGTASEELDMPVKNPGELSPESIAELAIYFFFNFDLPWWSPVKELLAFERLIQQTAWNNPFLLKKKIMEIADYHEAHFQNIISELASNEKNLPFAFTTEKMDLLLQIDLNYLSEARLKNKEIIYPEILIREISLKLQTSGINEKDIPAVFRTVVTQALFALERKSFTLLFENSTYSVEQEENAVSIANTWNQSAVSARNGNIPLTHQQEALYNSLKKIEEKYNSEDLLKGISITENLFSIVDWKNNYTPSDLFHNWLALFESLTGNATELVKQEIFSLDQNLIIDKNDADKKDSATQPASSGATEHNFLVPFVNYISVASLLVKNLNTLFPLQRAKALQFISQLFRIHEWQNGFNISFGLFFKYLQTQGISNIDITAVFDTLQNITMKPELKQLLVKVRDVSENRSDQHTYTAGIKDAQALQLATGKPMPIQAIIDLLIKNFQDKTPVLERLKLQSRVAKVPHAKKIMPEQSRPQQLPEIDPEGRIYIPNAGLVILWPFLSRLFLNLNYTEKGKFIDAEKQLRAIHLTQYLVGFTEDHPEYTLLLNKLMCGVDLAEPVERTVNLTSEEKTEAENLVSAVLAQWKEMNNTSVENFQRTFIQREGVLYQRDGNWYVKVDHTPFDILLLKLPWGLSIIKYPWNNYLIFVEWTARN
jgi:hypothetical protein